MSVGKRRQEVDRPRLNAMPLAIPLNDQIQSEFVVPIIDHSGGAVGTGHRELARCLRPQSLYAAPAGFEPYSGKSSQRRRNTFEAARPLFSTFSVSPVASSIKAT
jgi:hypothetical protein